MALRHLQVGDNLRGKTVYFTFPDNLYDMLGEGDCFIWTESEEGNFWFDGMMYSIGTRTLVEIGSVGYGWSHWVYAANFYSGQTEPSDIYKEEQYTFPDDDGLTIWEIDDTCPAYQYIWLDDSPAPENKIYIGNTKIKKIMVGDIEPTAIYLGEQLIYKK